MACKLCKIKPIYKLPNETLCKTCFIKYFENKVFKTIRKHNLFNLDDKLVVATSGGKDSITVLYLTHKFLSKKGLQDNVSALVIDEGIANYREHTIEFLENFCKKHKINLKNISYQKRFDSTLDNAIKKLKEKDSNVSPCNICGTFRRNALNIGARELGATKLVTGHNLDDEAQSILLNIFKNNFSILNRMGPCNGTVTDSKFIPRVKPLYNVTEKEVRLYTIVMGFDVTYDECPYSYESFRGEIGDMLNKLEDKVGGVKSSITKFYLEIKDDLQKKYVKNNGCQIKYCTVCGEPANKLVCNTCEMKEFVRNG